MILKGVSWCGEGDSNPQRSNGICKLLILKTAQYADSARYAISGHIFGHSGGAARGPTHA